LSSYFSLEIKKPILFIRNVGFFIVKSQTMTDENEEQTENRTAENLESVGQMIIGGIEQIGGILTGDPMTRAEGDFNVAVGSEHQETNKNLTAIENEEAERRESKESIHTETKE